MPDLYTEVEAAILESDTTAKCDRTARLQVAWQAGELSCNSDTCVLPIDDPGRPPRPELIDSRQLERRSVSTLEGRIRLLHAFAHIEFNAINIALDAVYRFRDMPIEYIQDWLLVATEEAKHFRLLEAELRQRGSHYGAHRAHRGLWDMVCKTRHNLLHRMALVPRVMEARGLDVTPTLIDKFKQVDDLAAVKILQTIYDDEIGHVRIGNHWYQFACALQGVDPVQTFSDLIQQYMGGKLRGPFNWPARMEAGFNPLELELLESDSV